MQLKDVMSKDVEIANYTDSLVDAARIMRDEDLGSLPVLEGQKLMGMITDRDIVVRAIAEGRDPAKTKVSDIVSREVIYAFEDQEVEEAAELMGKKQIRRLVVLNHEQRLVGIVSLGDIVTDSPNKQMAGETLDRVSRPS
jgi:CBS domain-containing protein